MKFPQYIYKITNTKTNKSYIGRSGDPIQRIENHMSAIKSGRHEVEDINNDYLDYPDSVWEFEILDKTNDSIEVKRERYWQMYYRTLDRRYGYNYKEFLKPKNGRYAQDFEGIIKLQADFLFQDAEKYYSKKYFETIKKAEAEGFADKSRGFGRFVIEKRNQDYKLLVDYLKLYQER